MSGVFPDDEIANIGLFQPETRIVIPERKGIPLCVDSYPKTGIAFTPFSHPENGINIPERGKRASPENRNTTKDIGSSTNIKDLTPLIP